MKNNLTVLICVHSNDDLHDKLLIKALKSLEEQTYKNFETLIVLDECRSETEEKIKNKNFKLNLQLLKKEKKLGLFSAKNFGLSFIKTDLVSFLDADDLYLPKKLEKQINFFENNDVDFLGTHAWNIKPDNDKNLFESCFDTSSYVTHEQIKKRIQIENILTHGSMMIKKSCLEKLGGYNNVIGAEDWDLWKRAFKLGFKFYQLSERLYVYRLNTSVPR
jgi:glycosyltransferase involved in cell wall biosynthesis